MWLWTLQKPGGDVRQLRPFALAQENVLEQRLSVHLLAEERQAVGPLVQVGLVDLEDIAGEHHLRALSRPGDDGLYFVRGEVLRLVHDEVHLSERAPADVGEGRDEELFVLDHRLDLQRLFGSGLEAALDHVQIVHQRLDVGAHLAPLVAGKIPDFLAAEHDGRPTQDDLVEVAISFHKKELLFLLISIMQETSIPGHQLKKSLRFTVTAFL